MGIKTFVFWNRFVFIMNHLQLFYLLVSFFLYIKNYLIINYLLCLFRVVYSQSPKYGIRSSFSAWDVKESPVGVAVGCYTYRVTDRM